MLRYLFATRWMTEFYDQRDMPIRLDYYKDKEIVYNSEFQGLSSRQTFKAVDSLVRGHLTHNGSWDRESARKVLVVDTGWYSHAQSGNNFARKKYYNLGLTPPPNTISIQRTSEWILGLSKRRATAVKVFWDFKYVIEVEAV